MLPFSFSNSFPSPSVSRSLSISLPNLLVFFSPRDGDQEVCLHSLRLLQSLLSEAEVVALVRPGLLDPLPLARIRQLASSRHPALRQTAQETLDDLGSLWDGSPPERSTSESDRA